jgi:hypothetical protein
MSEQHVKGASFDEAETKDETKSKAEKKGKGKEKERKKKEKKRKKKEKKEKKEPKPQERRSERSLDTPSYAMCTNSTTLHFITTRTHTPSEWL